MVTKSVLAVRERVNRWWEHHTSRQNVAAVLFVAGVIWTFISVFWGPTPLEFAVATYRWVWPLMTVANVFAFVGLLVVLSAGAVLWVGYYEQRIKVLEVGRDCSVLGKRLEELRLRLEVTEQERDGSRAKVLELQQQQDAQPFMIQHLRAEINDANNNRAHIAMELLVLMSKTNQWVESVVIRFIDYADHEMADEMKKYILSFGATWSIDTKHQPGDTIRPVHDSSRLELASGANDVFAGRLSFALSIGRYRNTAFHYVNGEPGNTSVVITIFPERKQKPIHGATN